MYCLVARLRACVRVRVRMCMCVCHLNVVLLEETKAGQCVCRLLMASFHVSSSMSAINHPGCHHKVAVHDCGTPWTSIAVSEELPKTIYDK